MLDAGSNPTSRYSARKHPLEDLGEFRLGVGLGEEAIRRLAGVVSGRVVFRVSARDEDARFGGVQQFDVFSNTFAERLVVRARPIRSLAYNR